MKTFEKMIIDIGRKNNIKTILETSIQICEKCFEQVNECKCSKSTEMEEK